jgi:hypothetical protein
VTRSRKEAFWTPTTRVETALCAAHAGAGMASVRPACNAAPGYTGCMAPGFTSASAGWGAPPYADRIEPPTAAAGAKPRPWQGRGRPAANALSQTQQVGCHRTPASGLRKTTGGGRGVLT